MNHHPLPGVTAAMCRLIAAEREAAQARLERDQALWDAKQATGLSARGLAEAARQTLYDLGYETWEVRLSHDTVRNAVEGVRPAS